LTQEGRARLFTEDGPKPPARCRGRQKDRASKSCAVLPAMLE
jgi:hypothetical protein